MSFFPCLGAKKDDPNDGKQGKDDAAWRGPGAEQQVAEQAQVGAKAAAPVGVLYIVDVDGGQPPVKDEIKQLAQPRGEGLRADAIIGCRFLLWGDAAPAGGQEQLYGGGIFHLFSGGLLQGGFLFFA